MSTVRPIILRPAHIESLRAGRRRHIIMAGTFIPGHRIAVTEEGKNLNARRGGFPIPTPWTKLVTGDMLWVQEELAALIDARHNEVAEVHYKMELPGGHVPIPGGSRGDKWRTSVYPAKKMERASSRYTLAVTSVRCCNAQDVTWEEMKAEGTWTNPTQTKGAWWQFNYGFTLPWAENPAVVCLGVRLVDGNIDTGERWVPPTKATAKPNPALEAIFASVGKSD